MSRPARRVALDLLREWEQGSAYAADLIERAAKSSGTLRAKDRPLVQQLVYTVIRNQSLLNGVAKGLAEGKLDPKTRRILRLGLAEALLLDGAAHATVNETVALASGWAKGVVNAILRRALDEKESLVAGFAELQPFERWSVPKFLWKRWKWQFGVENAAALAEWNQQAAPVYLRINKLKPAFEHPGLEEVEGHPEFLRVTGELPKPLLDDGFVYAQDPSTAMAIALLDPQPGEVVLDACAAPGGKTFAIACAIQNQGKIAAADRSRGRVERMKQNLDRLGVKIAECVTRDWLKAEEAVMPEFDRILLDVPCSNTGVVRRRIDVRWRLSPEDFEVLRKTQLSLLQSVAPALKPGGRLVYSTCSLETDENESVVEEFLAQDPSFSLIERRRVLPWRDGFDGAFAASLTKLA